MFCNIISETHQNSSAKRLDLAVVLMVICSCSRMIIAQAGIDCCNERHYKLQTVLGEGIGPTLVQDDSIIHNGAKAFVEATIVNGMALVNSGYRYVKIITC